MHPPEPPVPPLPCRSVAVRSEPAPLLLRLSGGCCTYAASARNADVAICWSASLPTSTTHMDGPARGSPSWWNGWSNSRVSRLEAVPLALRSGRRRDVYSWLLLWFCKTEPRGWRARLSAKRDHREDLRNVGIVVAVAIPGPAGGRIEALAVASDLFETRTVDAPHV